VAQALAERHQKGRPAQRPAVARGGTVFPDLQRAGGPITRSSCQRLTAGAEEVVLMVPSLISGCSPPASGRSHTGMGQ